MEQDAISRHVQIHGVTIYYLNDYIEALSQDLLRAKDLQRINAMGVIETPRKRGVMNKLLPGPVSKNVANALVASPLCISEISENIHMCAIVTVMQYNTLQSTLFAKRCCELLADHSASGVTIRKGVEAFIRIHPQRYIRKPKLL